MSRERKFTLIGTLILIVLYIAFILVNKGMDGNHAPKITFDNEKVLSIKVNAKEDKLLKGVHATDKEDGDLTDKIIIDSISAFNSNNERMVTYVVFDSKNKSAVGTRMISYKDYSPPVITLNAPLIQDSLSLTRMNKIIGAKSSVDGDISNNVNIKAKLKNSRNMELNVTVSDSTGTESKLKMLYEYDNTQYKSEIVLKKNIIYLKKGKSITFRKNIKSVMVGSNENDMLKKEVHVDDSDVNLKKPGVYNVYYYIEANESTNMTARTKAIVVVQ